MVESMELLWKAVGSVKSWNSRVEKREREEMKKGLTELTLSKFTLSNCARLVLSESVTFSEMLLFFSIDNFSPLVQLISLYDLLRLKTKANIVSDSQ